MTDNEIIKACPFEKTIEHYKKNIKEFFSRYKNKSGGEDCIEVCLIREGYRAILKAEEEINRQKAEIERLKEFINSGGTNLKNMFRNAKIEPIGEIHFKTEKDVKAEATKEFAERLCKDRVSNDPVVIAVKCELKEMVGDNE